MEFYKSPEEFKLRYIDGEKRESTESQKTGSLVDCLLTTPEEFPKLYAIFDGKIPASMAQMGFATELIAAARNGIQLEADEVYKKYYSTKNKSDVAIVAAAKALFLELKDYMNFKVDNATKIEISAEEFEKAKNIAEGVLSHPVAKYWMVDLKGEFQKKIFWQSSGIPIQILSVLDKVVIDDVGLRAKVIELKSMSGSNEFEFMASARKYRYPMQAAMYVTALTAELFRLTGKTYEVDHITIAVKNDKPHQCLVMQYSDHDMTTGYSQFYDLATKLCARNMIDKWEHNHEIIKLQVYREKED